MAAEFYTCRRTAAVKLDGDLDKEVWAKAEKTPRFGAMADGGLTLFDTRASMRWDDQCLYVAFWLQERDVWSTQEKQIGPMWQENAAVVCVDRGGAYCQIAVNPQNQISQFCAIWKDAYQRGGRYDVPEFDLARQRPAVYGGDVGPHHARGMRWAFFDWHLPGVQTAVRVDGTLDRRHQIDRGWTVEMALPWKGLALLGDGPPQDGDRWGIAVARYQVIDQRASRYAVVWTPQALGDKDLHTPECYSAVRFSDQVAD
jgi:hypothetical protein